mgnify:CR=1 FL=1
MPGMRIDLSHLDTTPGAPCWAAPPEPVEDYMAWLRQRFTTDPAVRQYMVMAASMERRGQAPTLSGPHAALLRQALDKLAPRITSTSSRK